MKNNISLRYLSADFTGLQTHQVSLTYACRSIRAGVSGRYPIIPPVGLPVLLISEFRSFISAVPFKQRNESHDAEDGGDQRVIVPAGLVQRVGRCEKAGAGDTACHRMEYVCAAKERV